MAPEGRVILVPFAGRFNSQLGKEVGHEDEPVAVEDNTWDQVSSVGGANAVELKQQRCVAQKTTSFSSVDASLHENRFGDRIADSPKLSEERSIPNKTALPLYTDGTTVAPKARTTRKRLKFVGKKIDDRSLVAYSNRVRDDDKRFSFITTAFQEGGDQVFEPCEPYRRG